MSARKSFNRRLTLIDRLAKVKSVFESVRSFFLGKRSAPAYSAAKKNGVNMLWRPKQFSSDAGILACADDVKARARDLARNNAFVIGSLGKIVNNVVGSSLAVQFQFLNADGELNEKLNDLLELRFREWARSAMMDGGSFVEMAKIIVNTIHVDGEILQNDVIDPRIRRGNPYRVQLFENDYLDVTKGVFGIDFDLYGSPTKYHLFKSNPSDSVEYLYQLKKKSMGETVSVSAENIRLIRYRTRSSGFRGISELASIVSGAYSLDQLQAAELNAMRAAQAFGLIITSPNAQEIADGMGYPPPGEEEIDTEEREELTSIPANGGVGYLNPGEKAETLKSD
ncbi:MAG: phage portal protein, partial [Candidatus Riflebacteria bacterium]